VRPIRNTAFESTEARTLRTRVKAKGTERTYQNISDEINDRKDRIDYSLRTL